MKQVRDKLYVCSVVDLPWRFLAIASNETWNYECFCCLKSVTMEEKLRFCHLNIFFLLLFPIGSRLSTVEDLVVDVCKAQNTWLKLADGWKGFRKSCWNHVKKRIKIWFIILCYNCCAFCVLSLASDCQFCNRHPNSPRTNFYTWRDRNFIRVILQLSPCLTCSLLKGHLHIFSQLPIHYPVYLLNVFSDHSEAIIKCRFIIIWYRLWLHNKNSGLCVNFCYATYHLPPKSYS